MSDDQKPDPKPEIEKAPDMTSQQSWRDWAQAEMTVTYPRWVFLAAVAVALLLLLAALD